jgi:TetR/AcrR family transcriptional repressor of nem operon
MPTNGPITEVYPIPIVDIPVQNGYTFAMVGRPKGFNADAALEKAMRLFWSRGYAATSVSALVRELGVGRQSLYDTFGNKKRLFAKAVDHYGRTVTQGAVELLESPGSPLESIRRWFTILADLPKRGEHRGCLVTNTAVELSPHRPGTAKAVQSLLGRIESALLRAVRRAMEAGELSGNTDAVAIAAFLLNAAQGLLVLGKAGIEPAKLHQIVDVTLSIIRNRN